MEKRALYEIIKAGVQAPSGDNTQPWIIKPLENYDYFILLAPECEPDFFDVENYATFVACGAFLENVRYRRSKKPEIMSLRRDVEGFIQEYIN